MRSYQHHIGDFNNATRHLTRLERSLYRDLIELYYDIERQLPDDIQWICRRIVANECSTDVERLLNEFFVKTPDGWYQDRCELEIEKFRNSTSQKAMAGKASAAKRAEKRQQAINGCSTGVDLPLNGTPTNHKPITKNQEPLETTTHSEECLPAVNPKEKPQKDVYGVNDLINMGVDESVARDFMKIRKKRKADLTDTALKGIIREAGIAGYTLNQALQVCAERSWQGFKAEWVTGNAPAPQSPDGGFIARHSDPAWRQSFLEKHTDTGWAAGFLEDSSCN